jgi:hypothetical protein
MFVMLFGLMGVAAIMPVGNHYAARSDQYDRGAALASSAFAELKSRGLLQPGFWRYANNVSVMRNTGDFWFPFSPATAPGAGHAFIIDPIGAAQATGAQASYFPYGPIVTGQEVRNPWAAGTTTIPKLAGYEWPIRRVTLPNTAGTSIMSSQVAASIFRLRDDLTGELPGEGDHPGIQRWETDNNGYPDEPWRHTLLARAYAGSYSWLATLLPVGGDQDGDGISDSLEGLQPNDPRQASFLYEVSVAVFRKREDEPSAASERLLQAELGPGGDLVVFAADYTTVDDASQDIRAGNWIALAGVHPTTGKFLLKWYRLLAYEDETDDEPLLSSGTAPGRLAMVEGPEWPTTTNAAGVELPALNLRAILLPNIIGVATQTVKLETN